MKTYQDLLLLPQDEEDKMAFVRAVINEHKSTEMYKTAVTAVEYDHKRNPTIRTYEKTLRTISGRVVPDEWSPNHKTTKNIFNYFTTQQNQYLLGNGVNWKNEDTGERLGINFDTQLQKAGKIALVQGEAFGFWNLDHMEVFEFKEFAPLYDEETGALRAGVRYWRIDESKPLRATLYEEDGYTEYIWQKRDEKTGQVDSNGEVLKPKTTYIHSVVETAADGLEIVDGMNYPSFPIVPLWGNPAHQSELIGLQEQIDAYDLIKNGFLNDLDTAQLYWIIKGAGGMDDFDLSQFMDKLKSTHFAQTYDGQEVTPVSVEIPYNAREALLTRIERDLYKDYGALNIDEIKGGAVTATQIMAAYEPLNVKADQYEYCVIEFIQGILKIAGIEDEPSFTRSKLVNVAEEIQTVLQAAQVLDGEYVTRKIMTLLGDGDQAGEILDRMEADELAMGGLGNMGEEAAEPTENGVNAEREAETAIADIKTGEKETTEDIGETEDREARKKRQDARKAIRKKSKEERIAGES